MIDLLTGGTGTLAIIGGVVLAAFAAIWRVFKAGKDKARQEQQEARLKAINKAGWVEREVNSKPDSEIDEEAKKWTR